MNIIIASIIIAAAVLATGSIHGTAWIIDTKTGKLEHVVGKDVTVVRP